MTIIFINQSHLKALFYWNLRTRRDINLDNSPSAELAVGQQSGSAAVISSAVNGYRPASTNRLFPALSWSPPGLPASAVNGQVAQSFPVALGRPAVQLPSAQSP